jgi:hypothetical protein
VKDEKKLKNTGTSSGRKLAPVQIPASRQPAGMLPEYRPEFLFRPKTGRRRPVHQAGNNNEDLPPLLSCNCEPFDV